MQCGQSTFVGTGHQGTTLKRYFCRSWKCPRCAPQKKKKLMKDAYLGRPNSFLTLTTNIHRFETPDAAAGRLVESFRRMREAIQHKTGCGPIPFIAVFEETEAGWPHLHILMRCPFVSQRWISDYMDRRMGSPIVHIEKIKSRKRCAAYVAKYLGKNPVRFTGCQRTWRNKFWLGPRKRKSASAKSWVLSMAPIQVWAHHFNAHASPSEPFPADHLEVNGQSPPFWRSAV